MLDDFQWLTAPSLIRTVDFLLYRSPDTVHWIISGRCMPEISLSQLRLADQLLIVDAEDLNFDDGTDRAAEPQTVPPRAVAGRSRRHQGAHRRLGCGHQTGASGSCGRARARRDLAGIRGLALRSRALPRRIGAARAERGDPRVPGREQHRRPHDGRAVQRPARHLAQPIAARTPGALAAVHSAARQSRPLVSLSHAVPGFPAQRPASRRGAHPGCTSARAAGLPSISSTRKPCTTRSSRTIRSGGLELVARASPCGCRKARLPKCIRWSERLPRAEILTHAGISTAYISALILCRRFDDATIALREVEACVAAGRVVGPCICSCCTRCSRSLPTATAT